MKNTIEKLKEKTYIYKKRFLDVFSNIGFGHLTSAFSMAELATVLFNEFLIEENCANPNGLNHRVIVSKGHGAGILYPIFEDLHLLKDNKLNDIIKIGGDNTLLRTLYLPGFDFYGGSLGIGLGMACGTALSDKLSRNDKFTFCFVGDGECYEGSIWESAMFAGANRLDNLLVIIDRNKLSCSDFTEKILPLEPFLNKWEAFGFDVEEIDGHNYNQIYNAFYKAMHSEIIKPHCIIANTIKGNGIDDYENKPLLHGYMPQKNEIDSIMLKLK